MKISINVLLMVCLVLLSACASDESKSNESHPTSEKVTKSVSENTPQDLVEKLFKYITNNDVEGYKKLLLSKEAGLKLLTANDRNDRSQNKEKIEAWKNSEHAKFFSSAELQFQQIQKFIKGQGLDFSQLELEHSEFTLDPDGNIYFADVVNYYKNKEATYRLGIKLVELEDWYILEPPSFKILDEEDMEAFGKYGVKGPSLCDCVNEKEPSDLCRSAQENFKEKYAMASQAEKEKLKQMIEDCKN